MTRIIHTDIQQRTKAWFLLRAGNVGASQAEAISSTLRSGKESARRRDLRTQLALENVLGHSLEPQGGITHDMQRGLDLESDAVARFSDQMGVLVRPCAWIQRDTMRAGVSPDGLLVGMGGSSDTLLEVKAPRAANHLMALGLRQHSGLAAVPSRNRAQLVHALYVSGFPAIHFVSYCPLFPPALHLYHALITRDSIEEEMATYALKLDIFLAEVAAEEQHIRALSRNMSVTPHTEEN
jgi:hypothetical protein